jgi:hypothetical protein
MPLELARRVDEGLLTGGHPPLLADDRPASLSEKLCQTTKIQWKTKMAPAISRSLPNKPEEPWNPTVTLPRPNR